MKNELIQDRIYYIGDCSPLCGGMAFRILSNGCIEAYYIGEFSPINHAYFIVELDFKGEDFTTLEQVEDAFYHEDGDKYSMVSNTDMIFMRSIDKEYTNIPDLSIINKFVRYDFSVWNLLKEAFHVPKWHKIHTYNGKM